MLPIRDLESSLISLAPSHLNTLVVFGIKKYLLSDPMTALVDERYTLYGFASNKTVGCSTYYPQLFSNVASQAPWILANSDASFYQCNSNNRN